MYQALFKLAKHESTLRLFCKISEFMLRRGKVIEYRSGLLHKLVFTYLHLNDIKNAERIENIIKSDEKFAPRWPFILSDFKPDSQKFAGKHISIRWDNRVKELALYFIDGIEQTEYWIEEKYGNSMPSATFILMNGKGPSPYNLFLNEFFLMIGHYRKTEFDRNVFCRAIAHELIHLERHEKFKMTVTPENYGVFKIFDEGYAEYCGFSAINHLSDSVEFSNHCARLLKLDPETDIDRIIKEWLHYVFHKPFIPTYPAAMSFVSYLIEKYGMFKVDSFFSKNRSVTSITDWINRHFGMCIDDLLQSWMKNLPEKEFHSTDNFFSFIKIELMPDGNIGCRYESKYPIWPEWNVFITDEKNRIVPIKSENRYRYQEKGSFSIQSGTLGKLKATILFDKKIQVVSTFF